MSTHHCLKRWISICCYSNCPQVKGPDSFSILTKALRVPAGHRVGLDIFTTDLPTFLHHLEYQAITFFQNLI